jgi:hypothetical protein
MIPQLIPTCAAPRPPALLVAVVTAFALLTAVRPCAAQGLADPPVAGPAGSIGDRAVREQRLALVIGNNAYRDAPLSNPVNDARAMAAALRRAGFDVILRTDVDHRGILAAMREFGDRLRQHAGVGLFYFAGHGMQIKGRNYLIPVGAVIEREDEVAYAAVDAQSVLDKMEAAGNSTNVMILDACRNNPFARSFRSSTQGLAQMDAPVGTLVAFATSPGSVASDGAGGNGLYTAHLLKAIDRPGLKLEDAFKQTRAAVRRESQGKQVPWESTSLEGDFYFHTSPVAATLAPVPVVSPVPVAEPAPAPPPVAGLTTPSTVSLATPVVAPLSVPVPAPVPPAVPLVVVDVKPGASEVRPDAEEALWLAVRSAGDEASLKSYLDRYPMGHHADEVATLLLSLPQGRRTIDQDAAIAQMKGPSRPGKPGAASSLSPAGATPAPLPSETPIRSGDKWHYQTVDRYRGEVVRNWSVGVGRIDPDGSFSHGNSRFDALGRLRYTRADGELREFLPHAPRWWAGMAVGDIQQLTYDLVRTSDAAVRSRVQVIARGQVVRREKVKVPAGEFDALRIEWTGPMQMPGRPGYGTVSQTVWYVPALHTMVAMEEENRWNGRLEVYERHELTSLELVGLGH